MTVAAIYARQSMDVSEGIARQLERAAAYIDMRGWDRGPEYVDNDTSATKTRGPKTAWARMLNEVGTGAFDVVVAVDLDRLLRTTRDLNTLIERGARVATVDGELDLTTADGEFRATMLAGIARFETRRKAERQIRANEHRVKKGMQSTAPKRRPFGFEKDGITHRPDEAKMLRDAYRQFVQGRSQGWIAKRWNDAGYRTSGGKPWTNGSIGHTLANPRNMGVLAYNGAEVGKAPWKPIVSEDLWRQARAMLSVGRTGMTRPSVTLLGGIAVCGECSGPMVASQAHGRRIYVCRQFRHVSRIQGRVDELVTGVLLSYLEREGVGTALTAAHDPSRALLQEGDALRARLSELASLFADGKLTADQVAVASDRIRARLKSVEAELAADRRSPVADFLGSGDVREAWERADVATHRMIVDEILKVTIKKSHAKGQKIFDPKTVAIEWRT